MVRATIVAILLVQSSGAFAAWALGEEREIGEGRYYTLVKEDGYWRYWRLETQYGITCRASLTSMFSSPAEPYDLLGFVTDRGAVLEVSYSGKALYVSDKPGIKYSWNAPGFPTAFVDYRVLGDRFWSENNQRDFDPSALEGKTFEAKITGWRYPAARVGYEEHDATFHLFGLSAAKDWVKACLPD